MMKRLMALPVTISLIAACATQDWYEGHKAGSGQQEFANEFLECKALALRLHGYEERNTIVTCMQGKGWLDIAVRRR